MWDRLPACQSEAGIFACLLTANQTVRAHGWHGCLPDHDRLEACPTLRPDSSSRIDAREKRRRPPCCDGRPHGVSGDKPNSVVDDHLSHAALAARPARAECGYYPEAAPLSRSRVRQLKPPVMPCTTWGFSCPGACAPGGGLLPRLFTLASRALRRAGRFNFLRHFPSRPAFAARARVFYAACCLKVFGLSSTPCGAAIACHSAGKVWGVGRVVEGKYCCRGK